MPADNGIWSENPENIIQLGNRSMGHCLRLACRYSQRQTFDAGDAQGPDQLPFYQRQLLSQDQDF